MSPRPSAISIVIPTYDVAEYIGACLSSLQAQTFEDFDVVVVNDGSPDDSAAIARAHIAGDERFTVVDQANRGPGPGGGRNGGLAHTRSDRLLFLDSDDALTPHALGRIVDAFDADPTVDIVSASALRLAGATLRPSHLHDLSHPRAEPATTAVHSPWLMFDSTPWNKAFRREFFDRVVGEWPEQQLYEDIVPMTRALLQARRIAVLADPAYLWRLRGEGSITHTQTSVRGDLAQLDQLGAARELVLATGSDDLRLWFDWKTLTQDLLWMTIKLRNIRGDERARLFAAMGEMLRSIDGALIDACAPALRRCHRAVLAGNERATVAMVSGNQLALVQDRRRPPDAVAGRARDATLLRAVAGEDHIDLFARASGRRRAEMLELRKDPQWAVPANEAPDISIPVHRRIGPVSVFRLDADSLGEARDNWYAQLLDDDGARGELMRTLSDALLRRVITDPMPASPVAGVWFEDGRLRVTTAAVSPRISQVVAVEGSVELRGSAEGNELKLRQAMAAWLTRPRTNETIAAEWRLDGDDFVIRLPDRRLDELGVTPHAVTLTDDRNPAIPIPVGVRDPIEFVTTSGVAGVVACGSYGEANLAIRPGTATRLRALAAEIGSFAPAGLSRLVNRPSS